jgi:hypothetical protein
MSLSLRFARRLAAAALALGMATLPAAAQTASPPAAAAKPATPEQIALARAIIDFTGAARAFNSVIPQLLVEARNRIVNTRPQLKDELDALLPTLQTKLLPRENDLVNEIAEVYASRLSESDLKTIVTFYRSDAGQKLTKLTPDILQESYGKAQEWSQKLSVEVMNLLREEMKKRGQDL